jgi:hypothetical protein
MTLSLTPDEEKFIDEIIDPLTVVETQYSLFQLEEGTSPHPSNSTQPIPQEEADFNQPINQPIEEFNNFFSQFLTPEVTQSSVEPMPEVQESVQEIYSASPSSPSLKRKRVEYVEIRGAKRQRIHLTRASNPVWPSWSSTGPEASVDVDPSQKMLFLLTQVLNQVELHHMLDKKAMKAASSSQRAMDNEMVEVQKKQIHILMENIQETLCQVGILASRDENLISPYRQHRLERKQIYHLLDKKFKNIASSVLQAQDLLGNQIYEAYGNRLSCKNRRGFNKMRARNGKMLKGCLGYVNRMAELAYHMKAAEDEVIRLSSMTRSLAKRAAMKSRR